MRDKKRLTHLVARAKQDEQAAFAELYSMFSKQVYYSAAKITGSERDAEDILQEVMLRLYKQLDAISSPESLPVYLHRITYATCVDWWRKNGNVDLLAEDDIDRVLGAEKRREFLPEAFAEASEQYDLVIDALDGLHPNYRAVLLMYYFNELSLREIAQVMGTSENVARVKLQNGRAALRRKLEAPKERKEVPVKAMAVPVLTQAMNANADVLFTLERNEQAWEAIVGALGLGAAATAAVAASTGTAGTAYAALSVGRLMAGFAAGIAATALVGTAVIHLDNPRIPTAGLPTLSAPYDAQPGEADHPEVPATQVDEHPTPSLHADDAKELADQMLMVTYGADYILRYPRGTQLSAERLAADAGIAPDEPLRELTAYGLDRIDPDKPNKYFVALHFTTEAAAKPHTRMLIVVMES